MTVIISLIFNVLFGWFWYANHQENNDIKKGLIIQYVSHQERVLLLLEEAIDQTNDREKFIDSLQEVITILYHNKQITGNGTPIGQYGDMPFNLFDLNGEYAEVVYKALTQAKNDQLTNQTIKQLEDYTANLSEVVKELDYRNKLWNENLTENKQVLKEVSDVIDQLFKN